MQASPDAFHHGEHRTKLTKKTCPLGNNQGKPANCRDPGKECGPTPPGQRPELQILDVFLAGFLYLERLGIGGIPADG